MPYVRNGSRLSLYDNANKLTQLTYYETKILFFSKIKEISKYVVLVKVK